MAPQCGGLGWARSLHGKTVYVMVFPGSEDQMLSLWLALFGGHGHGSWLSKSSGRRIVFCLSLSGVSSLCANNPSNFLSLPVPVLGISVWHAAESPTHPILNKREGQREKEEGFREDGCRLTDTCLMKRTHTLRPRLGFAFFVPL